MHILFFAVSFYLTTVLAADPRLSPRDQVHLSPLQAAQFQIARKWYQALPQSIQPRQLGGPPNCDTITCTRAAVGFSQNCASAILEDLSNGAADIKCIYATAVVFTLLYQGTCSGCPAAIATELSNDVEAAINYFYPPKPKVSLLSTLLTIQLTTV